VALRFIPFPVSLSEGLFSSQQTSELAGKWFKFISAQKGKCLVTVAQQDVTHAPLPNADHYGERGLAHLIPAVMLLHPQNWKATDSVGRAVLI